MGGVSSSKPKNLTEILSKTEFTQKEIVDYYKKFKQKHPSKEINEDALKACYKEKYPLGDAEMFAEHVFRAYDTDGNGVIDFQEFICGLSVISKGDLDEKTYFAFRLIDEDEDGYISKKELIFLLAAYFRIEQHPTRTPLDRAVSMTEQTFAALDKNKDDVLSYEEFKKAKVTSLLKKLVYE